MNIDIAALIFIILYSVAISMALRERFKIQDFICHIHNYTEYNQQWNVSQVCSMDSAIIWNTNTKNIHKYKKNEWSRK